MLKSHFPEDPTLQLLLSNYLQKKVASLYFAGCPSPPYRVVTMAKIIQSYLTFYGHLSRAHRKSREQKC